MQKFEEDIILFRDLFSNEDELLEYVVNNTGRSNYETANNKLENAKAKLKEKMETSSKEARKYLQKQHNLIELKQKRLNKRRDVLLKRKENEEKDAREAQEKQHEQQNQYNNQPNEQKEKIKYDPSNEHHAEIVRQHYKHLMAHVRSHKDKVNQEQLNNPQPKQVNESSEPSEEELRLKKIIAAGRILATNRRMNSESARKNSSNNIRMSKQKMVTQARTRIKF